MPWGSSVTWSGDFAAAQQMPAGTDCTYHVCRPAAACWRQTLSALNAVLIWCLLCTMHMSGRATIQTAGAQAVMPLGQQTRQCSGLYQMQLTATSGSTSAQCLHDTVKLDLKSFFCQASSMEASKCTCGCSWALCRALLKVAGSPSVQTAASRVMLSKKAMFSLALCSSASSPARVRSTGETPSTVQAGRGRWPLRSSRDRVTATGWLQQAAMSACTQQQCETCRVAALHGQGQVGQVVQQLKGECQPKWHCWGAQLCRPPGEEAMQQAAGVSSLTACMQQQSNLSGCCSTQKGELIRKVASSRQRGVSE